MLNFRKNKQLKADYQKLKEMYSEVRLREVHGKSELVRLREIEREQELIDRLLKNYQIIGVVTNKDDEKQYVCLSYSDDTITIILRNVFTRHPHPRLFAKIHQNYSEKHKTCELIDVFGEGENSGNGTILLQYLFIHLRKQTIWEVRGWLSEVDKDRFDKLEYFYNKNGFNVRFNEDRTSGKIVLTL